LFQNAKWKNSIMVDLIGRLSQCQTYRALNASAKALCLLQQGIHQNDFFCLSSELASFSLSSFSLSVAEQ
jgi:hypothetical protein